MSIFHNSMVGYYGILYFGERYHVAPISPGTSLLAKSKINGNNQIYFPVHKPHSFGQAPYSVERHTLGHSELLVYPFAALSSIDCSGEFLAIAERINRTTRKKDRRSPQT